MYCWVFSPLTSICSHIKHCFPYQKCLRIPISVYLKNLCAFKNFRTGVRSNFLGEEETEVSSGEGLVQGHTATYPHLGWVPRPVFLPHHPSFHSAAPFSFSCFLLTTTLLYLKRSRINLLFLEKKIIKTPCQPDSCTWPSQARIAARTCRKAVSPGSPQTRGAGGMLGAPPWANTWGGLLVITRKLGGTDGFGKHFCRVLLTEKKKERESAVC